MSDGAERADDGFVNWFERVKRSRIGLAASAVAVVIVGAASTTDAIDRLMIRVGAEPNALRLADDSAKGSFSRDFAREAWHRLFVSRRMIVAQRAQFSKEEADKTWDGYLSALDQWNSDLMVNILSIERFYGHQKRLEFTDIIQPEFYAIHFCLEAIRHPAALKCSISSSNDVDAIEMQLNLLNNNLYCFVSGFTAGGEACDVKAT